MGSFTSVHMFIVFLLLCVDVRFVLGLGDVFENLLPGRCTSTRKDAWGSNPTPAFSHVVTCRSIGCGEDHLALGAMGTSLSAGSRL